MAVPPGDAPEPAGPRPTPGFLLWRVTMAWRAAVDRALVPLGLTHAQYSLLASLYGMTRQGGRPSQRRVADHTGLDAIYVSKLVRALERSELVERAADPTDTRAVQLTLTPHGAEVAVAAIAVVADLHDQLLAPLGGRHSSRTSDLVDALQDLLTVAFPPSPSPAPPPSAGTT
ncbi:MAG: MarR family winged helix-turn-helix transcriptional regulator [Ilumatobacteraceae bacterium]